MAKGGVSEDELSSGLKGFGGLGAVGGTPGKQVHRDSPFRDSRAVPKAIEEVAEAARSSSNEAVTSKETQLVSSKPPTSAAPTLTFRQQTEVSAERKNGDVKPARRVADIYNERVTLQLSPEMRDEIERIAREIQRSKNSKEERITANSVMRVAIRLVITLFDRQGGQTPNTEEELFELMERSVKSSRR